METKTLKTLDGMKLTYYVKGQSKQTLFISNVPGLNIRFWFPIMELLSKKYRLIGFEYRGFPENKKILSLEQMELDRLVDDVEAIMDVEKVTTVHWLSWSKGCLIPQVFAKRHPKRTLSMVMLGTIIGDPGIDSKPPTGDFYGSLQLLRKTIENNPEIAERLCKMMRKLGTIPSTKFFKAIKQTDRRLEPVIRIVDILEKETSMYQLVFYQIDTPIGLRNYLNLGKSFSINNPTIRTNSWLMKYPILHITGETDGFLPKPNLGKLEWYPRLKEVMIAHGSHFLVIERPEIVANHIDKWINKDYLSVPRLRKPSSLRLKNLTPDNYSDWRAELNHMIYKDIKDFIENAQLSHKMRELSQRLMDEYIGPDLLSCTHSLLLVYYAETGKLKPAIPIATICSMIWAGAHCFDDLNDGDLSNQWDPRHAIADASVISSTFASILIQERLRMIRMSANRYRKVQGIISQGLLNLLGGQLDDLHATGKYDTTFESIESSVKFREPFGLFMRLGAEFAGATPEVVDAYGNYGDYYGLSGSLVSDFNELYFHNRYRDLKNGTCTLYLALCLAEMSPDEKLKFIEILPSAREDIKLRLIIVKKLKKLRFVTKLHSALKKYRTKALNALEIARPPEPIREILVDEFIQPTYK